MRAEPSSAPCSPWDLDANTVACETSTGKAKCRGKLNTAHPDGAPAQRRRLMSASNSTYESRVPRRGPESIPPRNAIAASIAARRHGCHADGVPRGDLQRHPSFLRVQSLGKLPAWSYTHRCASRVAFLALAVHIAQDICSAGTLVHGDSIWPERASLWSMHGQPQRAKWLSPGSSNDHHDQLSISVYPPTESSKRSPRSAPKHTPKYQP